MANATSTQLQELYVAYFGRAADPTGLDYWTEAGTTQASFAASMYAQAEFKDAYGSKSVEAQVNQIYKNLFDREADVTGLTYWTQQINLGVLKVAEIATHLIWAAQNNSGSTDDKTALTNRTNAAIAYTAEVKSTTANILAYQPTTSDPWVAGDNITEGVTYLSGVDKDTAHTASGVTASVAKFTAITTEAAKTLVLTKDTIDTLTGGTGNDTFIGDNNTISAADTVTGGAGTDTLKLTATTTLPNMSGIEKLELKDFTLAALNISGNDYSDITNLRYDTTTVAAKTLTLGAGVSVELDELTGADASFSVAGDNWTSGTFTITDSGDSTNAIDLDFVSTKTTAVTIKESGSQTSYGKIINTGAKAVTVNIDADYKLTLEDVAVATTIDASDSSGTLTLTTAISTVTFTGGTGNDTLNTNIIDGGSGDSSSASYSFGTGDDKISFTNLDAANELKDNSVTVAGGAGTDTFSGEEALIAGLGDLSTANFAKKGISGWEKVEADNILANGDTYDISNWGANYFIASVDGTNDSIIGGLTSGATLETGTAVNSFGGAAGSADDIALVFTDKGGAGDVLNVVTKNTAAAGLFSLDAQEIETINIDATASDQGNSYELDVPHATKITVDTGTGNVTIDLSAANGAATLVNEVDASAATSTGGLIFTADGSNLAGITFKGSAGGDNLTGGALGDVFTAGAGNDIIDGSDGTDTADITSGGTDTIEINSLTGKITVTGFASGDIIDIENAKFDGAETAVTAAASSAIDVASNRTIVSTINAGSSSAISSGSETIADFTDLTDVAAYLEEGFAVASNEEFVFVLNDGTDSYVYINDNGNNTVIASGDLSLAAVVKDYTLAAADVSQS